MKIVECKIIADSIYSGGPRITTLQLRYPRIIHGELLTHRVFSRNSGSSRAKPSKFVMNDDMFIPKSFRRNKKGMSPGETLSIDIQREAKSVWIDAYDSALESVRKLKNLGVHKQWANRLLEPFSYIDVVITGVEWDNFHTQRSDKEHAQDEMYELSESIKKEMDNNTPVMINFGEWHLPYIDKEEFNKYDIDTLKRISTARCARVSYRPFKESELSDDLRICKDLIRDKHGSPLEHVVTPAAYQQKYGNLRGWKSFRCEIENTIPYITVGRG